MRFFLLLLLLQYISSFDSVEHQQHFCFTTSSTVHRLVSFANCFISGECVGIGGDVNGVCVKVYEHKFQLFLLVCFVWFKRNSTLSVIFWSVKKILQSQLFRLHPITHANRAFCYPSSIYLLFVVGFLCFVLSSIQHQQPHFLSLSLSLALPHHSIYLFIPSIGAR